MPNWEGGSGTGYAGGPSVSGYDSYGDRNDFGRVGANTTNSPGSMYDPFLGMFIGGGNNPTPAVQAPQAPPQENPLFAQARSQAVNDMMGGGWGQGYQQPQMNPMQMYGGQQQQMQSPFSMFGGPNSGFDWGNYFGTFGGK